MLSAKCFPVLDMLIMFSFITLFSHEVYSIPCSYLVTFFLGGGLDCFKDLLFCWHAGHQLLFVCATFKKSLYTHPFKNFFAVCNNFG